MKRKRRSTPQGKPKAAKGRIQLPGIGSMAWSRRYGERHRLRRVTHFLGAIRPPGKVRIYSRREHHILQFWDPSVKKTLNLRVEGDLLDALAEARRIDQRLHATRNSGCGGIGRLGHADLVQRFKQDLDQRVEAGVISLATARRYGGALKHYLTFTSQPSIATAYPHAARVNRSFAMELLGHLNRAQVTGNGRLGGQPRAMRSADYILDVVRALYEWAADPQQGNLLPMQPNPFRRKVLRRRRITRDLTAQPDITLSMAQNLLEACDDYQLRLLAPVLFYGLRPGELLMAFHEKRHERFLSIECLEPLDYPTKGRRPKQLPLLEPLYRLLTQPPELRQGLIFRRRHDNPSQSDLLGASLQELAEEYHAMCRQHGAQTMAQRLRLRDQILHRAGGTSYKRIEGEFQKLARFLDWPKAATLKDLRHLCNTALANGHMSETERRYLLGHDLGHAAILNYTHLTRLHEHYQQAVQYEMAPLLAVLERRVKPPAAGLPING